MTTARLPASEHTRQSALDAAATSLPAASAADRSRHDRHPPGHARLPHDRMSLCFEVSPPRAGSGITEGDARRVRMARRVTAARLRYCGLENLVDDVTLIVSELVTNAILHSGGTQITFTLTVDGGFLRITVHDGMPGRPVVRDTDDDAEQGRGLFLVQCLIAAHNGTWGTVDDGATIWCSLALPGGRP
ncbi:ATP-binding protein [Streptomyces hirsutus]|uniref:ATP-binding protein n=1 Tax=Streptomyces hirsutus TaxID=35620 RepID=UPI003653743D